MRTSMRCTPAAQSRMTNSDAHITARARVRTLSSSEVEFSASEVGRLLALAMDVCEEAKQITKRQKNNAFYEVVWGTNAPDISLTTRRLKGVRHDVCIRQAALCWKGVGETGPEWRASMLRERKL